MTVILYRGTDIGPELAQASAQFARAAEPITAKPFPYRKPEAKESHAVRVYVAAYAAHFAHVCVCVHARTRETGG